MLSRCPEVTVLATSRERLGLPGERVVPIAPLPLASDAEALFRARAAAVDPAFTAEPAIVAEICARLDGMPLAIELAAARGPSLGAGGLLAALDDMLRLLVGSRHPDERHRSLRAVLGWSHDLLGDDERALFPRLAVFAGAFDLDAARQVAACSPDVFQEAARRAPTASAAAADLRTAAQAVFAVGPAGGAFDLLLDSATHARAAGDPDAHTLALAQAVLTAGRFTSGFPEPVPSARLRELLDQAAANGSRDPVVAAHLAAATAWCPTPDPALAETAVAAARATGDPVLLSAALDASGTLAMRAGRFRQAHLVAGERLAQIDLMDRRHPASAAEILDSFHNAWLCALATGDLSAALATAERIARDDLLGAHPYRAASKLIPPLVLVGRFEEAVEHAEPMWHAWQRSAAPIAAWLSPAASAVALAHGLRGDRSAYRLWRSRAGQTVGALDPMVFATFVDARVAVHTGAVENAPALVSRAFTATGWAAAYARAATAELAVLADLPDAGHWLAVAAETTGENDWAVACLARAHGRSTGTAALRDSLLGWSRIHARFEHERTALLM
ncbi:hypothetical protein GCM10009555_095110 [Acrocarpospora macrocephala]|uniref:LuxR family transcriptional regulator n=1 Tax=Acrocarpospora macrocephala TaxID=150177 RepID=A0A5M3WY71_9ACTN|nr:hypothetical protein [Acrocarpospora macrocephala]GES11473.1 hypothetical protein Amac_050700 [Acrocarpospora macrocephala]